MHRHQPNDFEIQLISTSERERRRAMERDAQPARQYCKMGTDVKRVNEEMPK